MSSQSNASAKRRRAGVVNTPIFKSEDNQQSASAPVPAPMDTKKPMSLQQVITVFDQRLLHLEKIIIEQGSTSQTSEGKAEIDLEQLNEIQQSFQTSISKCVNEFDHRYNLLANEVVELKEMLLKLQSYTLEVNKALYENKVQSSQQLLKNESEKKIITENSTQTKEVQEAMDEILEKAYEEIEQESSEEKTQTDTIEQHLLDKEAEPWDEDTFEESHDDISASPEVVNNLEQSENMDIDAAEQNVSEQEKGKKRKRSNKKSINVSLEENS